VFKRGDRLRVIAFSRTHKNYPGSPLSGGFPPKVDTYLAPSTGQFLPPQPASVSLSFFYTPQFT
jgi:hypothetical protein